MTDTVDEQTTELSRRERREAKRAEKAETKAARKFEESPVGMARAARQGGEAFFQTTMAISERQHIGAFTGIDPNGRSPFGKPTETSAAGMVGLIEAEGWRLESTGYVFEQTGQVSRDKFMSSGQQTSTLGRIVGIYLFRAV